MSRYYHTQPGLLASLQLHPADQINQNVTKSHIPDVLSNMFLETLAQNNFCLYAIYSPGDKMLRHMQTPRAAVLETLKVSAAPQRWTCLFLVKPTQSLLIYWKTEWSQDYFSSDAERLTFARLMFVFGHPGILTTHETKCQSVNVNVTVVRLNVRYNTDYATVRKLEG